MKNLKDIFNCLMFGEYKTTLPPFIYRLKAMINSLRLKFTNNNKECLDMHKYIYGALGAIVLSLIVSNVFFYKQNQSLNYQVAMYQAQLNQLTSELKTQNEAIAKLALDTQNYKSQIATNNAKWQKKYNDILSKLDTTQATCEEQLTNMNEQFKAFMGG